MSLSKDETAPVVFQQISTLSEVTVEVKSTMVADDSGSVTPVTAASASTSTEVLALRSLTPTVVGRVDHCWMWQLPKSTTTTTSSSSSSSSTTSTSSLNGSKRHADGGDSESDNDNMNGSNGINEFDATDAKRSYSYPHKRARNVDTHTATTTTTTTTYIDDATIAAKCWSAFTAPLTSSLTHSHSDPHHSHDHDHGHGHDAPHINDNDSTTITRRMATQVRSVRAVIGWRNFVKGCRWSPDGTCVLTNSEDHRLRLWEVITTPNISSNTDTKDASSSSSSIPSSTSLRCAIECNEGECIYDYCWYPLMNSSIPSTCQYVSTSTDHPIHLWDAFTGDLRATYRAYNQVDELTSAISLAYSIDGTRLFGGFNKQIRIWDVERPGRDCTTRSLVSTRGKGKNKRRSGQTGLISCIATAPTKDRFL
jgi:WD40 repeat protein